MFLRLATQSLWHRKSSVIVAFLAITISVFILLAVEHIRHQVKQNFNNTISGVDLIVGARTGDINLLLYSVFRIGDATQNIDWQSYQNISQQKSVAWSVPISLGDSHKGYRVVGTSKDYFTYFKYGQRQALEFAQGRSFDGVFDVVIGADIARQLGYKIGSKVILAHGTAQNSFSLHEDTPFTVVGILAATGTPVDRSLHISLGAMEAIHMNWKNGIRLPGKTVSLDELTEQDLQPKTITAFMLGLKNKITTFHLQREINNYQPEALFAIIPGVTLSRLWQMLSSVEMALSLISLMVLVAALLGLAAMLLSSIRERLREIAVLRALGMGPWRILLLIELEAVLITSAAVVSAFVMLMAIINGWGDALLAKYGIAVSGNLFTLSNLYLCLGVFGSGVLISLIPAITAYTRALHSRLAES
ncbi:ABC transporter permease [Methylophaga sp.]|uniref:ABC transporter permease n=1 Tax=Methylophaga sp. TaxID=2024840 RepID=UPI003A8CC4D6